MTKQKTQRLDKVLSHMGIGTRKEIKKLVKASRVEINGQIAKDPSQHVRPYQDLIKVDGYPIKYREFIYLMMNKPPNVLSATEDRYDRVVTDLLEPEHSSFSPFPVGRLDKDTEGLLILTNDGKLAHQLLSPKKHVPKVYYATIDGEVTDTDITAFQHGVELDDGYVTIPSELRILKAGKESEIELTIYEGKFHQVKRMFEAVGKRVTYLKRLSMGSIQLDPDLDLGEYRECTEEEIMQLKKDANILD